MEGVFRVILEVHDHELVVTLELDEELVVLVLEGRSIFVVEKRAADIVVETILLGLVGEEVVIDVGLDIFMGLAQDSDGILDRGRVLVEDREVLQHWVHHVHLAHRDLTGYQLRLHQLHSQSHCQVLLHVVVYSQLTRDDLFVVDEFAPEVFFELVPEEFAIGEEVRVMGILVHRPLRDPVLGIHTDGHSPVVDHLHFEPVV